MGKSEELTKAEIEFGTMSHDPAVFKDWGWKEYEKFYFELLDRSLDASNLDGWMRDWTAVAGRVIETYCRLIVDTRSNTTDKSIKTKFETFLNEIFTPAQQYDQKLKLKLLESGLKPENFEQPLLVMQTETKLYREENLDLLYRREKTPD